MLTGARPGVCPCWPSMLPAGQPICQGGRGATANGRMAVELLRMTAGQCVESVRKAIRAECALHKKENDTMRPKYQQTQQRQGGKEKKRTTVRPRQFHPCISNVARSPTRGAPPSLEHHRRIPGRGHAPPRRSGAQAQRAAGVAAGASGRGKALGTWRWVRGSHGVHGRRKGDSRDRVKLTRRARNDGSAGSLGSVLGLAAHHASRHAHPRRGA